MEEKIKLMPATTVGDFIAIREKINIGGFASVTTKETSPFEVYKWLLNQDGLDFYSCHCYTPNSDIAIFCVMPAEHFFEFLRLLGLLERDKNVIVDYTDIDRFVQFCNAYGLNVMGGAFLDDGQVLYID